MADVLNQLEDEISALSDAELRDFRSWFHEFDAAYWDEQLSRDVNSGKLDGLAAEALEGYAKGHCKPL